ncbi:MAG TPA: hypothetical protein VH542_02270, partial [Steroidobacteraceae bacterium]
MIVQLCDAPIADERLLGYWLGEVAGVEENALDEHLLGCDNCSERLRKLADLGAGVRAIVARGGVQAVITDGLLECLARQGLQIREYSVFPSGSVNCTVAPDDDLL